MLSVRLKHLHKGHPNISQVPNICCPLPLSVSVCLLSEAEGWDSRGDQWDWKPGSDWREVKCLSTSSSVPVWEAVVHSAFVLMEMYSWGKKNDQKKHIHIWKTFRTESSATKNTFHYWSIFWICCPMIIEIKNAHHIFLKGPQIACVVWKIIQYLKIFSRKYSSHNIATILISDFSFDEKIKRNKKSIFCFFSYNSMTVNRIYFCCGQNKTFFTIFWHVIDQTTNSLIKKTINRLISDYFFQASIESFISFSWRRLWGVTWLVKVEFKARQAVNVVSVDQQIWQSARFSSSGYHGDRAQCLITTSDESL